MRLAALRQKNWLILHDVDSLSDDAAPHQPGPALFDGQAWRRAGLVTGEAPGRGESLFIDRGNEQWVLRPYRRGGLVAHLCQKRYLWLGVERTRAFRELRLTAALYDQGLPVPRPVAAGVKREGLVYQAALITVRIEGARALASRLSEESVDEALLERVGEMIARFHKSGLDHVDLNARNILIDEENTPWLIDFDRCRFRQPGRWQTDNLERLARSVAKFSAATDAVLAAISAGYASAS
ncbi:3-deoxy-D-manno-octulosonic acid kinase [Halomonas sp. PAMB 3264]|uniref:3-deoxy-D-manno-octulosonic acid kinase n=1 Tax=Halomonas sp. PAMB 3264 TaxID=3075222 RepID=UPI0028A0AF73|nr:3-deoxy-D-manno-octulosonic acid kinase [Halomonas sp. PAMB 3264]WNL42263.1 3-deoxy-D-manno-octulosonic acid kinase [Halomonas sp. PAMB 3264]